MAKNRKLSVIVGADISRAEKAFWKLSNQAERTGKQLTKSLTAPLVAVGGIAAKAAYDIDDALDKIRAGTGATGKALEGLSDDFRAVARNVPHDFDTVATAIADVNTRLGYTGKGLQDFSSAILDASRLMGTDYSSTLNASARAMQNWNVSAANSVTFMDKLFIASQSTGIGMDRLAERISRDGATFRQLGYSVEEAMALIGNFEKQGVEVEKTSMALRMAVANLTRGGSTNIGGGFREAIKAIKDAGSAAQANAKAIEVFGSRAGPEMATAIREGRLEVEALVGDLDKASGAIQQTVKDTDGFAENMVRMKNKIGLAFEPLGNRILAIADEALDPLMKTMDEFSLDLSDTTLKIGMMAAALGPLTVGLAAAGKAAAALVVLLASPAGLAGIGVGAVALAGLTLRMETLRKEAEKTERAIQAVNDQFKDADSKTIQAQLDAVREKMKSLEVQAIQTAKATNAIEILNTQKELNKKYRVGGGSRVPNSARVPQQRGSRSTQVDRVKPVVNAEVKVLEGEMESLKRQEAALDKLLAEVTARENAAGKKGTKDGAGDGIGGGKSSKKSPTEILISGMRDQIKYMGKDAKDFLPALAEWEAKLKPLSDDWKLVKDLQMETTNDMKAQEKALLQAMAERHKKGLQYAEESRSFYRGEQAWMTQQGLMGAEDYLAKLKGEFASFGGEDMLANLVPWTDEMKDVFGQIQSVTGDLTGKSVKELNKQLESGKITTAAWKEEVTQLMEQYKDLPLVVANLQEIRDGQEKNKQSLIDLNDLTVEWARDLQSGIADAILEGKNLTDVLSDIGREVANVLLKMALFGKSGTGGLFGSLFGGLFGFADGGVFVGGRVTPFAKGGVVTAPTLFPMANGAGLMGEAGAEAVMPLKRIGGRLGVEADLSGGAQDVTVNIINQSGTALDATRTDVRQDPVTRNFVVDVVVQSIRNNGAVRQAMRAAG